MASRGNKNEECSCPICGAPAEILKLPDGGDGQDIHCENCGEYFISLTAVPLLGTYRGDNQAAISHYLWQQFVSGEKVFLHSNNVKTIPEQYPLPDSNEERLDNLISFVGAEELADRPIFQLPVYSLRAKIGVISSGQVIDILNMASRLGLVEFRDEFDLIDCRLTDIGKANFQKLTLIEDPTRDAQSSAIDVDAVAELLQGATNWNEWRRNHPEVEHPNLSNAKFTEMNLAGVDLHGADLRNSELGRANLQDANLHGADLRGAILDYCLLVGGRLENAILHNASLKYARLDNAVAIGAEFNNADLSFANLKGVDLSKVLLVGANIGNAEFRDAVLNATVLDGLLGSETAKFEGVKFVTLNGPDNLDAIIVRIGKQIYLESGSGSQKIEPTGNIVQPRLTAGSGELCLNIHQYGAIMELLLRHAEEGDFCFALFGEWGRGKTEQMRAIEKRITKAQFVSDSEKSLPERARDALHSQDTPESLTYEVVWFKAWEYKAMPELWVHLYETFRSKCNSNPLIGFPRIARASIARTSLLLPGLFMFVLIICAIWRLYAEREVKTPILTALLSLGGVSLPWFFTDLKRLLSHTARLYGTNSEHSERLGLQASIGGDLEALLKGWIPDHFRAMKHRKFFRASTYKNFLKSVVSAAKDTNSLKAAVLTISLLAILFTLTYEYAASQPENTNSVILVSCGFLVTLLFLFYVFRAGRGTDRLLLVVDDLDRCEPEQMLTIIESLKLMLERDIVKKRVQIVMLIEPETLRSAIYKRYPRFMSRDSTTVEGIAATTTFHHSPSTSWKEHVDKLFIAHLTLPPLTNGQVRDLVRPLLGVSAETDALSELTIESWKPATSELPFRSPPETESSGAGAIVAPVPQVSGKGHVSASKLPGTTTVTIHSKINAELGETEKKLLASMFERLAESSRSDLCRPRQIRSLKLKYLMCRMILEEIGTHQLVPKNVVSALLDYSIHGEFRGGTPDDVASAVRQVCLDF